MCSIERNSTEGDDSTTVSKPCCCISKTTLLLPWYSLRMTQSANVIPVSHTCQGACAVPSSFHTHLLRDIWAFCKAFSSALSSFVTVARSFRFPLFSPECFLSLSDRTAGGEQLPVPNPDKYFPLFHFRATLSAVPEAPPSWLQVSFLGVLQLFHFGKIRCLLNRSAHDFSSLSFLDCNMVQILDLLFLIEHFPSSILFKCYFIFLKISQLGSVGWHSPLTSALGK